MPMPPKSLLQQRKSSVENNPFSQIPSNPFEGLSREPQVGTPAGLTEGQIDRTARMAAISNAEPDDVAAGYQQLTAKYADRIRISGDMEARVEAATKQQATELTGLTKIIQSGHTIDPTGELVKGAQIAAQNSINEDVSRRAEYALEQRTWERVQDAAASGDDIQARVLIDNVKRGGSEDVLRDIAVKKMIIQREVEKAGIPTEQQGMLGAIADFVVGAVGDLTLNSGRDRNNLVDIDKAQKHWYDMLLSGGSYRAQAASLWSMNPADFATTLRNDVLPRIKQNATDFGYTNNTEALELLKGIQNTPNPTMINAMDAVNIATIVPFLDIAKAGSIPYMMTRAGARKEAAQVLADTTLATLNDGAETAAKLTGVGTDEVVDNILPSVVNPSPVASVVPLSGDTLAAIERGKALIAELPSVIQPGRMTDSEMAVAIEKTQERIAEEFGRPLKDVRPVDINLSDGSKTTRLEFTFGKKKGGGFASEASAKKEATARWGIESPEVVRDESGQWFIKDSRDMNESGFYTTNLNPGLEKTGIAGRLLLGARQVGDELLGGLDRRSANARNRLLDSFKKGYENTFRALNTQERDRLGQVMSWGENKSVWLDRDQLSTLYRRLGHEITDKEVNAYQAARDLNDIEYTIRNDVMWKSDAVKGAETVSFDHPYIDGGVNRRTGFVNRTPDKVPSGRVFDVTTDTHYNKNNPLTAERIKAMADDGYILVSMKEEQALRDGTTVKHFLMKGKDARIERLRPDQLAYRAGGHRMYSDRYFVKQAVWGVQKDTGEKFLKNPSTYITGTKAEVERWAKVMETARLALKGGADNEALDGILGELGHMDGETFRQQMKDGVFQADTEFTGMFDREMPREYVTNPSAAEFVDLDETGFTGWLRTNGRMYYSGKGERLLDWKGQKAATVDPFEMINTSLSNVANLASFSDYKISAVERWVRTYRDYLNTGGLPRNASDLTIFQEAKWGTSADKLPMQAGDRVRQAMEAQRDIIRRNIGWKTEGDNQAMQYGQRLEDYIMGNDPESVRHRVGKKATEWWNESNPISAMRGFAFDLKMGLFNVAQFPLQIQTIVAATALAGPEHSIGALSNFLNLRLYLTKSGTDHMLTEMVNRGANRALGMEANEYRVMMKSAKTSGFFEFGGSHQMINSYGPNAVAGGFKDGVDKVRRAGRFAFNEGEVWNRATAWQLAWKDVRKAHPDWGILGNDFQNRVALRADDYSMNMMEQSSASWQHGLASIPTQFFAYNARMLEAFLGKQFTTQQKMRLFLAQSIMYGSAGIPLVGVASDVIKSKTGKGSDLNTVGGAIDRGLLDNVIYHMTGADVLAGQRYGGGKFLTDTIGELMGMSAYGQKSVADVLGGATFNIMDDSLKTFKDLITHTVMESGAEDADLVKEDVIKVLQNASTFSYGMKAMLAHNYGIMVSNKGTVTAHDLPPADAAFFALGIPPGSQDQVAAMMSFQKNKKKHVDEAVKFIVDHRTRMAFEPDHRQEIANQINTFIRLLPEDVRVQALSKANRRDNKAMIDSLTEQMNKDKARADMVKLNGSTER